MIHSRNILLPLETQLTCSGFCTLDQQTGAGGPTPPFGNKRHPNRFFASFRSTRYTILALGRWAMRFPSRFFGLRRQQCHFNASLTACVLTVVLTPSLS